MSHSSLRFSALATTRILIVRNQGGKDGRCGKLRRLHKDSSESYKLLKGTRCLSGKV